MKIYTYSLNSLRALAKEGDLEEFARIDPPLDSTKNVFDDGSDYPFIDVNTPFLTTKTPEAPDTHPDQARFQTIVQYLCRTLKRNPLF